MKLIYRDYTGNELTCEASDILVPNYYDAADRTDAVNEKAEAVLYAMGKLLAVLLEKKVLTLEECENISDTFGLQIVEEEKPVEVKSRSYFSADGTLMNSNGTRSIFDDVDK